MKHIITLLFLLIATLPVRAVVDSPPPVVWQQLAMDCGAANCEWIREHQGLDVYLPAEIHTAFFGLKPWEGIAPLDLAYRCQQTGAIITVQQQTTWDMLEYAVEQGHPAIVQLQVYGVWHYATLIDCWDRGCSARDPAYGYVMYRRDEIERGWDANGNTTLFGAADGRAYVAWTDEPVFDVWVNGVENRRLGGLDWRQSS